MKQKNTAYTELDETQMYEDIADEYEDIADDTQMYEDIVDIASSSNVDIHLQVAGETQTSNM